MHSRAALAAILTAAALATPVASTAEAEPGEGKKKRLPKPTQTFEQGPMTRQQRRYAERKTMWPGDKDGGERG